MACTNNRRRLIRTDQTRDDERSSITILDEKSGDLYSCGVDGFNLRGAVWPVESDMRNHTCGVR